MLNTTITFAGNLVDEPQLQFTTTGKPVAAFRVLVNRRVQNQAGEWEDGQPTAHNCKIYGPTAENIAESIGKGDRVLIHGEVRTESWDDKETSEKRYKDVVFVEEIGPSLKWATAKVTRNTRDQQD